MALRNDQGIVLRGYPFGDSHRVVVLLSPNHGKLRTVAKGVRKTKSRFGGRLEPFTHVDLVLYEGTNLDTITQVSIINAFPNLRHDLDKRPRRRDDDRGGRRGGPGGRAEHSGCSCCSTGGWRCSMQAIVHDDLVTSFLLKAADVIGVAPALDACAGCGRRDGLTRFSFAAGGSLCDDVPNPGRLQPQGRARRPTSRRWRRPSSSALPESDPSVLS